MYPARFLILALALFTLSFCSGSGTEASEEGSQPASREFYQLKVYTFDNAAQQATTDQYLAEAFLPALQRQGIGPVGVFQNRLSEEDTTRKTFVLIPFARIDQFLRLDPSLEKDPAYQEAGSAYLDAPYDASPYQRIESVLMQAFEDMPRMQASPVQGERSDRIYELRSYESPTEELYWNKVDMFNAGGEVALFDRLGFNAVFYGEVLSGSAMPNLMYMTTFPDRTTRDSLWNEFREAPEWKALLAMDKYKNNVSHSDIFLLYPTPYSDY